MSSQGFGSRPLVMLCILLYLMKFQDYCWTLEKLGTFLLLFAYFCFCEGQLLRLLVLVSFSSSEGIFDNAKQKYQNALKSIDHDFDLHFENDFQQNHRGLKHMFPFLANHFTYIYIKLYSS